MKITLQHTEKRRIPKEPAGERLSALFSCQARNMISYKKVEPFLKNNAFQKSGKASTRQSVNKKAVCYENILFIFKAYSIDLVQLADYN